MSFDQIERSVNPDWVLSPSQTDLVSVTGLASKFFFVDFSFNLENPTTTGFYLEVTISTPDAANFYNLNTYRYYVQPASSSFPVTYQSRFYVQVDTNLATRLNLTITSASSQSVTILLPQVVISSSFP